MSAGLVCYAPSHNPALNPHAGSPARLVIESVVLVRQPESSGEAGLRVHINQVRRHLASGQEHGQGRGGGSWRCHLPGQAFIYRFTVEEMQRKNPKRR